MSEIEALFFVSLLVITTYWLVASFASLGLGGLVVRKLTWLELRAPNAEMLLQAQALLEIGGHRY